MLLEGASGSHEWKEKRKKMADPWVDRAAAKARDMEG